MGARTSGTVSGSGLIMDELDDHGETTGIAAEEKVQIGFRRLSESSGVQVRNLDHMKRGGISQPTARSREA